MDEERKLKLAQGFAEKARLEASQGNADNAITEFEKAIELGANLTDPAPLKLDEIYLDYSAELRSAGRIDDASEALELAYRYIPDAEIGRAPPKPVEFDGSPNSFEDELGSREAPSDPIPNVDLDGETSETIGRRPPESPPLSRGEEKEKETEDTPLVFVPGILGSSLAQKVYKDGKLKTGTPFWPPDVPILKDPSKAPTIAINGLRLQAGDVVAFGLFPGVYNKLMLGFKNMGYNLGENFWVYPYDWRQSNRISGEGLVAFIKDKLSKPRFKGKKMDVVCHSMGGLVTRYAHRKGAPIDQVVYLASPHYGAAKAHFALHPGIKMSENFIESFIVEAVWNSVFRQPGDVRSIQAELKRLARSFQSAWELLPDRYAIETLPNEFIWYEGRSGKHDRWIKNMDQTYYAERWGFPPEWHDNVKNAMDFKENVLGFDMPGHPNKSLVIWSDSEDPTFDAITYERKGSKGDTSGDIWKDKRDNGGHGDGTVPMASARHFRKAVRKIRVPAEHNRLPNETDTIDAIERFLGRN